MSIANTLLEDLRLLLKETERLIPLALSPYGQVLKGKSLGYGEIYGELLLLRNRSEKVASERLELVRTVASLRERLQAARDDLTMFRQNVEALTPLAAKNQSLRNYLDQEIDKALAGEGRVEVLRDWTKMLEEDAARMQITLPEPVLDAQQECRQGIREWLEVVASRPGEETICIAQYRREDGSYELSLRDQIYDPAEILKLLSILDLYKPTIQAAVDLQRARARKDSSMSATFETRASSHHPNLGPLCEITLHEEYEHVSYLTVGREAPLYLVIEKKCEEANGEGDLTIEQRGPYAFVEDPYEFTSQSEAKARCEEYERDWRSHDRAFEEHQRTIQWREFLGQPVDVRAIADTYGIYENTLLDYIDDVAKTKVFLLLKNRLSRNSRAKL